MQDRVAIIVATDRRDCNSLVLEHSLRPLLNLLGYCTVPTVVFARDDDFVDLHVAEEAVMIRARRAVGEAFRVLGLDPHSRRSYQVRALFSRVPSLKEQGSCERGVPEW
jgi:hypothetical protein